MAYQDDTDDGIAVLLRTWGWLTEILFATAYSVHDQEASAQLEGQILALEATAREASRSEIHWPSEAVRLAERQTAIDGDLTERVFRPGFVEEAARWPEIIWRKPADSEEN